MAQSPAAGNIGLGAEYLSWTRDRIAALRAAAAKLRSAVPESAAEKAALQTLFEHVHDIKGMGSSFNFPLMTSIGGSLCVYVQACMDGKGVDPDVVAAHIKAMDVIIEHKITGTAGERGRKILARLAELTGENIAPRI